MTLFPLASLLHRNVQIADEPDAEVFRRSSRADHSDGVGAAHDLYSSNLRSGVQTSAPR